MQEKWSGKGLSILAVTDEPAADTEKFIAKNGVQYAYAYDKGGKLSRYFGVNGIPHAVLVDATGTVLWAGHPGALEDAQLQAAVSGALPKPLWEWSGAAKGVKSALLKHGYKSALDQAAKLGAADGGPEILAAIQGIVKTRVSALKAAYDAGNFLAALGDSGALQKELVGLPELADAQRIATDLAANKKAQDVIKGQQKIAKVRATQKNNRKDLAEAIDALRKIKKDYPGTYVDTEADALIRDLNDQANKM